MAPEEIEVEVEETTPERNEQDFEVPDVEVEHTDKDDEHTETEPDEKKKSEEKKNHAQRRWERMIRERAEFKAKAEFYESQITQKKEEQPINQRPKKEDFDTPEKYMEALADYTEAIAVEIPERVKAEAVPSNTDVDKSNREFIKSHPDFEEVLSDAPAVKLYGAAVDAIIESEVNAELRYYLASHPDEYENIADISRVKPIQAAKMIGVIESRLQSKKATQPKTTNAPEPRKPSGGRANVERDPEKMSMAEFAVWDAERLKKKK